MHIAAFCLLLKWTVWEINKVKLNKKKNLLFWLCCFQHPWLVLWNTVLKYISEHENIPKTTSNVYSVSHTSICLLIFLFLVLPVHPHHVSSGRGIHITPVPHTSRRLIHVCCPLHFLQLLNSFVRCCNTFFQAVFKSAAVAYTLLCCDRHQSHSWDLCF